MFHSRTLLCVLLACLTGLPASVCAEEDSKREYTEQTWGIGIGLRYAEIPFYTASGDRSVTDVVPLMFYDDKHLYIRGLEGGIKLYNTQELKVNALLRYRWFDIPADIQNEVRGDAWDSGFQLRYRLGDWDLRTEVMGDGYGRFYTDVGFDTVMGDRRATLYPYLGLRIKTADFNTKYYGFDQEYIAGGAELHAHIEGRYHLVSNLYVIGRVGGTLLDDNAHKSSFVKRGSTWDAYAGIAFFNKPDSPPGRALRSNAYLRIATGEATPSNIGEILGGHKVDDPYHNKLTSLFYGYPVTDALFGLPIDVYLTPGLVYHHHSQVQESFYEYVIAMKGYYTFKGPLRWRLGLAEGLSYSSQINYVERTELEAKGYRPSKVLNYLDFSVDLNIGDIFNSNTLRNTWFGYSIHHRSGIFESGSQFGRIKGGSNYTTLYLQQHF
ncbi:MAG: MipA/OmpV family protein [Gammaproteobacteria bacterium]|nr:MipA/OmpV family protein [Gammaproteobacteria bacterium]